MIDLVELQKRAYNNKVKKGFNVEDVHKEFCFLHEEVAEANRAYYSKLPDLGEELADIAIFLLGLSEILNIDLEKEILAKMEKNEKRKYELVNGVYIKVNVIE